MSLNGWLDVNTKFHNHDQIPEPRTCKVGSQCVIYLFDEKLAPNADEDFLYMSKSIFLVNAQGKSAN